MSKQIRLTREDLYERVWEKPTVRVAEEFGISDVMVAKLCRKMDVPKPPLGYWQKKQAGAKIKPASLPKLKKSTKKFTFINVVTEEDIVSVPPRIQELIDREDLQENKIEVSDNFDDAHPLIISTKDFLDNSNCRESLICPPEDEGYINVLLSKAQINRGLLLLNALFLALEDRGYSVEVTNDHWGERTNITKEGEKIEISLREKISKISKERLAKEQNIPTYLLDAEEEYVLTGKLRIKINFGYGRYKTWNDRKNDLLEDRLNEIAAHIIGVLERSVEEKRKKEAEELRRQEAIRLREEEDRKRDQFEWDAKLWHKTESLRSYLDAYESKLLELKGEIDPDGNEAKWLEWARDYIATIDPLKKLSEDSD